MKALIGAFNKEKAQVGSRGLFWSMQNFAKSHWQLYWYWIPDRQRRRMLDTCTLYISSSNKLDEESWRDQMDCWKINKFISWLTLFDFWEKGRKVCSRKYNKSSLLHLKFPHTLNTPNKVQITWFELQMKFMHSALLLCTLHKPIVEKCKQLSSYKCKCKQTLVVLLLLYVTSWIQSQSVKNNLTEETTLCRKRIKTE